MCRSYALHTRLHKGQRIAESLLRRLPESRPQALHDGRVRDGHKRFHGFLLAEISRAVGIVLDGLEPGDKVKVVNGPFAGYAEGPGRLDICPLRHLREAVFDTRLGGSDRVRVLLELIRQGRRPREQPRFIPAELNAGIVERMRR